MARREEIRQTVALCVDSLIAKLDRNEELIRDIMEQTK